MHLEHHDAPVATIISQELERSRHGLELIPSENYVSMAVLQALGSVMTNKYAEGYPGNRYYGGCANCDELEQLAIDRAKELFGAEHANVQPLSGAPANMAAYFAVLKAGDTVLGMDLSHGGHLTHGHPVTVLADLFNFVRYKTGPDGLIDMDELRAMAKEHKPKLILAGYSSYSRRIDYAAIKEIADEVGALTMMDMAHIAGLIAGKQMDNPVPHFDIVTTTTHKTLRGPRGGMILCTKELARHVDKAVFPGLQGGPHQNNIAAKAIAFGEALDPSFEHYAAQVMKNASVLADELGNRGWKILFGGTENHLVLVDVTSKGLGGSQAEKALDMAGMTVNKNVIPDDPRSPMDPSGIRIGTPAITTRGMKEDQVRQIAAWMDQVLCAPEDSSLHEKIAREVKDMLTGFPLYPELP